MSEPRKTTIEDETAQQNCRSVMLAVMSLHQSQGIERETVFDGAIRAACALMLQAGLSAADTAELLELCAKQLREAGQDFEAPLH